MNSLQDHAPDLVSHNKKPKTSSPNGDQANTGQAVPPVVPPPPPPPPLLVVRRHLGSLPDIAHEAISSYLTNNDMMHLMETSLGILDIYALRIEEVDLMEPISDEDGGCDKAQSIAIVMSLLRRRPSIKHITMSDDASARAVVEAITQGGLCQDVRGLIVQDMKDVDEAVGEVIAMLAEGRCPKIDLLDMYLTTDTLLRLGEALKQRMEKGCCRLKTLRTGNSRLSSFDLTPVLSSGACGALEELVLYG